ncbi:MAG: hypothetical protein JSV03_08415 [Planctomycetota bacterium]|nr:MAG: hypothetical protein JSV03_08415 [Planctomycetota bacterium]
MTGRCKKTHKVSRDSDLQIADRADILAGRASMELPVSLAKIIEGVKEEIEQLSGQAGLPIMKAMMEAEIESIVGPKDKHELYGQVYHQGHQGDYVVLAGQEGQDPTRSSSPPWESRITLGQL